MKTFENIDNIQDSIGKLKKHLENADYLISYLEQDLDKDGTYNYVDSAMYDIKSTYYELLKYIDDLEQDLDDIVDENQFH